MRQVIITKEPVTLTGNLAILPKDLVERLEDGRRDELQQQLAKVSNPDSVSYTHLTLPTILLV